MAKVLKRKDVPMIVPVRKTMARIAPLALPAMLATLFAVVAIGEIGKPAASIPTSYEQNTNSIVHQPTLERTYGELKHRGGIQMLSAHRFPRHVPERDFSQLNRDQRALIAARIGEQNGVPGHIFAALVMTESGFDPAARSHVGAIGFAQLMPATARELGVDPYDPWQNLSGGARYLRVQFERFGNWQLALAAYNAGPTRVARLGRIPRIRETQDYVRKVLHRAEYFRGTV